VRRDEFVRRVEDVAGDGLGQQGAEQAIEATLTTLGELLGAEQSRQLAAQLPVRLQGPLRLANGAPGRFAGREFVRRVAVRRRLAPSQAFEQARAVVHVLEEAISDGERERLRSALSDSCPMLLRPPAAARWPQRHEAQR
jgi:uncharacterized protein (DUF2267 family)